MDNISFKDNFYGKSNLKRHYDKLVQVFNNRTTKLMERQPFKNFKFSICVRLFKVLHKFLPVPEPFLIKKKETLAQIFSCQFWKISKNTFSYRTPLVAASESL